MAGASTLELSRPAAPAARPSPGPAVEARGLCRRFRHVEAVRGVDLEVRRGEIFGLVGPDGAGKSTLIQMLCGILDPTAGRASVLGLDTVRQAAALGERVGYMSQSFSLYGTLSVAENLEFFADLRSVPPGRRRERIARLLRFTRLEPFLDRPARQLSGGMQKKLALAACLVHDPEILLLDEPTTGVDPLSRRDFWEIVFDFLRAGVTVLVATPYLDEAERCHRVALVHEGRILAVDAPDALRAALRGRVVEVEAGDPARAHRLVRADPAVEDAQLFGRSVHARVGADGEPDALGRRLRAAGAPVEAVRRIEPSLEDAFVALISAGTTARQREVPTPLSGEPGGGAARPGLAGDGPAVEVSGLTRSFGGFVAVDGVSFTVAPGEVFGLLGPNGSGKSTTIRMLTGILAPSGGLARVAGADLGRDGQRVKPLLGYMSQRFSLYDDLSAAENLEFFAGLYGVPRGERGSRERWALEVAGLGGRAGERARDLPGGLKQRLALACAIVHRPRILFLDEPTSGVDPLSRRGFWDLIFDLAGTGVAVLVSTHYMDEAERCQRLAIMDAGRIAALGTPRELRLAVPGHLVEASVADPVAALALARQAPGVAQATLLGTRLHLLLRGPDPEPVRAFLATRGHPVAGLQAVAPGMEDVFAAVVEAGRAGGGP